MNKPERRAKQARTLRVELVGATGCRCAVAGLYACATSPIIEMCRLLVSAGYDLGTKLVCFRGGMLSMTVHGIGQPMRLTVLKPVSRGHTASPMRQSRSTFTSGAARRRRVWRRRRAANKRAVA